MKRLISILVVVLLLLISTTAVASTDIIYVVIKGDTLSKIGKTYGVPYMEIAKKNNIANPNLILIGQKLIIPSKDGTAGAVRSDIPKQDFPKQTTPVPDTSESAKVTITDVTGRVVTLDQPASYILGTHNPSLNTGIVLGGGDKYIIGFGNKQMANKLYNYVMDDYDGIVEIGRGNNINFETVVTLGKNNVAILPERFVNQVEQFENVGVPAVVALPNSESFDTIKESLTIVGKVLGENDRAKKINSFIDKSISDVKSLAQKAQTTPSVLFLGSSSPFSVASSSMIQSDIIEMAGGINAARNLNVEGAFAEVNIEQIIAWNPEIIWVPCYASYTVDSLLNDPKWSSIKAIKNKAVYVFPSELEPWDYPTASACLGLRWGLYNLHPDLYGFEDLMKDTNEFYDLVYGNKFTAQQLGIE
jgi:iron complex transport system substrate-binding protein